MNSYFQGTPQSGIAWNVVESMKNIYAGINFQQKCRPTIRSVTPSSIVEGATEWRW